MAKIFNNIFGSLSGAVGPLVFYRSNGCDYVRRRPIQARHRCSPAQEKNRTKFKLVSGFIASIKELASWSFKERARFMTGSNYAISCNMARPLTGNGQEQELDFSLMSISGGSLPNVEMAKVRCAAKGKIDFSWKYHPANSKAAPGDKCILLAYNPRLNKTVFTVGDATREEQKARLHIPASSEMGYVHTWISFISEDGKSVANSIYTGALGTGHYYSFSLS